MIPRLKWKLYHSTGSSINSAFFEDFSKFGCLWEIFYIYFKVYRKYIPKYLHQTFWYTIVDISKEIRTTWRHFKICFSFWVHKILIFQYCFNICYKSKSWKSLCSSDLLTNIYNCIPKGLIQIFQYFLYTLKYIKKNLIDAHTNTGVRIYRNPRKWQNLLNFRQGVDMQWHKPSLPEKRNTMHRSITTKSKIFEQVLLTSLPIWLFTVLYQVIPQFIFSATPTSRF